MKSSNLPLVLVAVATLIVNDAAAQEGTEPPRTLEIVEAPASSTAQVVSLAASKLARAITSAPNTPQPSPPLQDKPIERPEAPPTEPEPATQSFPTLQAADFPATLAFWRRFGLEVDRSLAAVDHFADRLSDPVGVRLLDLQSYVADPGWGAVIVALYDDKCLDAKAQMQKIAGQPSSSDAPALQYVWARIGMCAGDATGARKTLRRLSKRKDAIGVLAARRLGKNVTIRHDEDGEGMYLSGRIRQAKRLAKKDHKAALRDLDELHGEMKQRWDRFKVERARADVLQSAGRTDEAATAYVALYRKSRNWSVNGEIEDQIEAIERRTKKRILTYGERIDRMRSLVARGRYTQAKKVSIENAKIRGVSGKEIRGWMYYRLALQAEREKKRKEATELFEKANKLVRDSEVRPRLYFGWARALRRTDRDTAAIALYERLCKEYAKHHLCDEALYEAGRLLQFKNEHADAIAKFDAVIDTHKSSDHLPEALWRKAFSHYLEGQYASMRAPLERLRAEFGDERDESELTLGLKATYWLAMASLKLGDRTTAQRLFQETVDRGTLTWYGRLADVRMAQNGWDAAVQLPSKRLGLDELRDLSTLRVPHSARLEVAGELVRLGLWKDAIDEMRTQTAIHPVPQGAHSMLAATYLAKGRPDRAHWIMKKHIVEAGPTWSTLRDWGTAFPLDYMDLAHEHGTQAGVSPFLVQAIIRQESGFRPRVSSWAGAVGLMQLMPGTAAYTARVFHEERTKFRLTDLKDPARNVRLGSRYIRLHTAHAAESIPLALAGYNAGPRPLESWIKRYSDRELDAWVESITYREARGYVRKVYTSYVTYAALYGGELPTPKIDVPAKLREWGDVPEIVRQKKGTPVTMLDAR